MLSVKAFLRDETQRSHVRLVVALTALIALRLVLAAVTPLTFDEAYYWTWSKNLAGGYYDHPPMVAYVIRLGTLIAGDTPFGVRLVSVLLAIPMTVSVYRAAAILFGSARLAASAALLLNATLMVAVGTLIITPDAPLMAASAFTLHALAKVLETGRGAWWLAVGASVGAALLSKYTALFFGPSILIWLVAVPKLRRWLISPWPYLGGLVALLMFAPAIAWNMDHEWVSFLKQFGRARIDAWTLKFFVELIPAQLGLATPFVFVLGAMGMVLLTRRDAGAMPARALLMAMVWPVVGYFVWHSLHARVEANWFGPIYPVFAIAGAAAMHFASWTGRWRAVARFCARFAVPAGVALFVLLGIQVNTGMLNGFRRDPSVRAVGVGWRELALEIEAARARTGAGCIIAPDYGTTSWLMFYLPRGTCVAQGKDRFRWSAPEPDAAALAGKLLFIGGPKNAELTGLTTRFARAETVAMLPRKRGALVIETYQLVLTEGPLGEVLDRARAPELGVR